MLESLDVISVAPYRDRPYEWVVASAHFAVDPRDPANARIVDLGRAAPREDGLIHFVSDVRLLRPAGPGNGRALVVIPNRGLLGGIPFSLDALPAYGPTEDPDPGDGFLLDQGWTIAWCGWQWDVLRHQGAIGFDAPLADVEPGWMRIEFRPDVMLLDHRLSDSSPLFEFKDYPPADPDDPEAQLTVRTRPIGDKHRLSRDAWSFADGSRVVLAGGFQPFHWYELTYRAAIAPVVGAGLLAVRDFSTGLNGSHDRVFAFGVSQSGRFLRQFLYDGLNVDEHGRQVFAGVFTHLGGARRGEFNCRYGQPGLTHPLTPGYGPPYDNAALLAEQRRAGGVPKLVATNSSTEYWRGDGALLHQHPVDGSDLPEDPDARTYVVAGTDHFGPSPLKTAFPVANPTHSLNPAPVLRALFVALEKWVCDGLAPPPSRVPRRCDNSAVDRRQVLAMFHDAAHPDPDALMYTPAIDPDSTSWPLETGEPMIALVSDVDEDGNEVAGVRLPGVAVPVAAYTGWNPRAPRPGLPDVLYEFVGSRLPRQSAAVLPGRADYQELVRAAAQGLVEEGFVLDRDLGRIIGEAMQLYDALAANPPG
jgi:hypothetical protein